MTSHSNLSASLLYINDQIPGITRKKKGKTFIYFYPDNRPVVEIEILDRIKSLAIPPAYTQVWISPVENGHIQATGRDSKNRKQYRYHTLWRKIKDENKFNSMLDFGKCLPKIRNHIDKELTKPLTINKTQVICAIIYLLDNYFIRIGNTVYEKQNNSYGLTTLRKKHLLITNSKAKLKFKGKNLKSWEVVLKDKKIITLLKKCESIPGYKLFKYLNEQGQSCEITSQDINTYLQTITNSGYSFTAKDFRTWGACRETFFHLSQTPVEDIDSSKALSVIIGQVANLLGHTAAICQKSYIYPEIIIHWKSGKIHKWIRRRSKLLTDKDKLFVRWLDFISRLEL